MSQDAKTLYSGTFERSMDAKKRVAVPAPWLTREEGETFYVIPHPSEGYLMVMPPSEFDRWEQRIQESPATATEKRMAIRKFYSEAHTTTTDKQGRILLSEKHCDRAGIANEVIFAGGRSRFEIWSKRRYTDVDVGQSDAYRRVADTIGL
jgi:transcriptional regulator MraZ